MSRLVRFLNLLQGTEPDNVGFMNLWVYYLIMSPSFYDRERPEKCLKPAEGDIAFRLSENLDHYHTDNLIQASETHNHQLDQAAAQTVAVRLDNKEFVSWASGHLNEHYAFMGYYCFLLFRAYNKSKESTVLHLTKKGLAQASQFMETPVPEVFPYFNDVSQAFVRSTFRINYESYRKMLKMVIANMLVETRNAKREQLFDYCIKVPLAYVGLHPVKLLAEAFRDSSKFVEIHEYIANTKNTELYSQFDQALGVMLTQRLLNIQHPGFLNKNPSLKGQTCNFLPYCRVLDPRYHGELHGPRNQALICYAVGLKGQDMDVLSKICCLRSYDHTNDETRYYNLGLSHRKLALPTEIPDTGIPPP